MIHKNGVRKFGSRDAPSPIVSARVASALVVRVERFAVHFGGESPAPKALKGRTLGTHHRGRPDAPDLAQHVLCQALQVVMVAVKVRQGFNQRFIALDRFGSVPPCGGAERTSTFLRSECRLPPLLVIGSSPQRRSAPLKVFRCGPRHYIGGQELAAHVDKPRKEEAAGVLDRPMVKVRGRLGRRLRPSFGGSCACRLRL